MTSEEKYISQKCGNKQPFRVPEGYFDTLADRIIEQIPKQQTKLGKAVIKQLKPWFYAAACIVVAVFTATMMLQNKKTDTQIAQAEKTTDTETYYSDTYIDEEADYAMVDNQDIYAYLLAEM